MGKAEKACVLGKVLYVLTSCVAEVFIVRLGPQNWEDKDDECKCEENSYGFLPSVELNGIFNE